MPHILVGAGTVLTINQAEKAVSAGAEFIVSPGFNPKIVDFCITNTIPVIPGVNNGSQIEEALEKGLNVLKFFPAEISGGVKAVNTYASVYGNVRFVPTGGLNKDNISSYLQSPAVLACGGSWMVQPALIEEKKFSEIEKITREAVEAAIGFRVKHIGMRTEHKEETYRTAEIFRDIFEFPLEEGGSVNSTSPAIKLLTGDSRGKNGQIGIETNSITMAMAYLERQGLSCEIDSGKVDSADSADSVDSADSAKLNKTTDSSDPTDLDVTSSTAGEKIRSIYLKKEIAGFAIRVFQK